MVEPWGRAVRERGGWGGNQGLVSERGASDDLPSLEKYASHVGLRLGFKRGGVQVTTQYEGTDSISAKGRSDNGSSTRTTKTTTTNLLCVSAASLVDHRQGYEAEIPTEILFQSLSHGPVPRQRHAGSAPPLTPPGLHANFARGVMLHSLRTFVRVPQANVLLRWGTRAGARRGCLRASAGGHNTHNVFSHGTTHAPTPAVLRAEEVALHLALVHAKKTQNNYANVLNCHETNPLALTTHLSKARRIAVGAPVQGKPPVASELPLWIGQTARAKGSKD